MKKTFIKSLMILACGAALTGLTSCGDELKPYPWIVDDTTSEEDPSTTVVTMDDVEGELKGGIPFLLNYSHEPTGTWAPHKYQYQRTNSIDNYAGYWTTTKANFSFGPALPTLYTDDNGYLQGPLDQQIFQQCKNALEQWNVALYKNSDKVIPRPEWRAIALICESFYLHEIVDFFGVAAYEDWRVNKRTSPINWEAGPEVYKKVLADLDEAIALMKEAQPDQATLQRVEGTNPTKTMTNWNWRYWVKFANSIKLRMALNMVDYNDPDPVYGPDNKPFVAKNIAEEAVADEIGVLLPTDDIDIAYRSNNTWVCCLYFLGAEWNDIRLNASFENILKHFNNPLLEKLFDPNSRPIKNAMGVIAPTGIYGVRAGLMMEDTGNAASGGYGPFAVLSTRHQYMDQPFFKRSEATFLRAEGALRGWTMGGTPEGLYEEGIKLQMRQFGISDDEIEAYLNQEDLPAVPYRDYYNRTNDINEGRVTIGVKWDENDTKEVKLEKIITQKWINCWPQGAEAWTTFRRTGYPRLFPVKYNNMNGVDTELQIRRLTIRRDVNNGTEVDQITELLGGEQTAGTRVFWDVRSATWGKDDQGRIIPQNF